MRDHPIAGGELTYLDGVWTAKSDAGHEIAAQVYGEGPDLPQFSQGMTHPDVMVV